MCAFHFTWHPLCALMPIDQFYPCAFNPWSGWFAVGMHGSFSLPTTQFSSSSSTLFASIARHGTQAVRGRQVWMQREGTRLTGCMVYRLRCAICLRCAIRLQCRWQMAPMLCEGGFCNRPFICARWCIHSSGCESQWVMLFWCVCVGGCRWFHWSLHFRTCSLSVYLYLCAFMIDVYIQGAVAYAHRQLRKARSSLTDGSAAELLLLFNCFLQTPRKKAAWL